MKSAGTILLDQTTAKDITDIEAANAVWNALAPTAEANQLDEWRQSAFYEDIAAAMRLSGVKTSAKDVQALLANDAVTGTLKVGERKTRAFAAAMQTIRICPAIPTLFSFLRQR